MAKKKTKAPPVLVARGRVIEARAGLLTLRIGTDPSEHTFEVEHEALPGMTVDVHDNGVVEIAGQAPPEPAVIEVPSEPDPEPEPDHA